MQYSFSRATCGVVHPIILICHKILQLLESYHNNFKRLRMSRIIISDFQEPETYLILVSATPNYKTIFY